VSVSAIGTLATRLVTAAGGGGQSTAGGDAGAPGSVAVSAWRAEKAVPGRRPWLEVHPTVRSASAAVADRRPSSSAVAVAAPSAVAAQATAHITTGQTEHVAWAPSQPQGFFNLGLRLVRKSAPESRAIPLQIAAIKPAAPGPSYAVEDGEGYAIAVADLHIDGDGAVPGPRAGGSHYRHGVLDIGNRDLS
jgi:hypothetical protein